MKTTKRKGASASAIDHRYRKITGFVMLVVASFLALSYVSYLFTWKHDQDAVINHGWGLLFERELEISNWLGPLGAIVSHVSFFQGFGATSFLFVYLLAMIGMAILKRRPLGELQVQLRWGLIGLLGMSVVLAFVFQMFDFPMGGAFGYILASGLESIIGIPGMLMLMLLLVVSLIIWVFNPSMEEIRSGALLDRVQLANGLKAGVARNFGTFRNPQTTEDLDEDEEFEMPLRRKEAGSKTSKPEVVPGLINVDDPEQGTSAESQDEPFDLSTPGVLQPRPTARDSSIGFTVIHPKGDEVLEEADIADLQTVGDDDQPEGPKDPFQLRVGEKPRDILPAEAEEVLAELGPYDPKLELRDYQYPTIQLLNEYPENDKKVPDEEINENQQQIIDALASFGVAISGITATVGPTITLYEIVPAAGVRSAKFRNLGDDIALSLSALGIRIIAPMPGRGTIGIEVPNKTRRMVPIREVLASKKYLKAEMELPIALGKTIQNETMVVDLAKMPHLLVAGATGQGKSVGINTIIMSLLYRKHPAEVKLVLVDPKKVELSLYSRLEKHFLTYMPNQDEAIITENKKVIHTLLSLCEEMEDRLNLLKMAGERHIRGYNKKFTERRLSPLQGHKFLPYIVIIIDEFADLIMTAGKEIEQPIARIAQVARAVGIHLIIATQRPSVKIITGTIKANFPARLAFRVTSLIDSRTILDSGGAEQLVGMGDMLLSEGGDNVRLQCAFVDTPEVERVLDFIDEQTGLADPYLLPEYIGDDEEAGLSSLTPGDADTLLPEAARMVVENFIGSTSMLQRRMKIGFNRAGRIMDELCLLGIVGEARGSKPRDVLVRDMQELSQVLEAFYGEQVL